jgi:hypothetical protein
MINRTIKYLVLSDIHLGHKNTSAEYICNNLDKFFNHYSTDSQFSQLDIIFIAGDLLDDLLDMKDDDVNQYTLWMYRLMSFCLRHKIKLRVLKGTPSHDWDQPAFTRTLHQIISSELDFKYIDTLSIEIMDDLSLNILYVPDEWSSSSQETYRQVEGLLKEKNLNQADIAIMHGLFRYQMPEVGKESIKHDEQSYLDIVAYFINIGHIHTHSTYGRILAQGSFDRLAHGEEHPKGAMMMIIHPDGEGEYFFIENKNAKIYKTIKLKDSDIQKSLSKIDKKVINLPKGSYVRIVADSNHPVYVAFEDLKRSYPELIFKKESTRDDKYQVNKDKPILEQHYLTVQITPNNIKELLKEAMKDKYSLSSNQSIVFESIFNHG